ncbi:alpha/beta hydrolase [Kibdelosporangium phytohabitans]|uniref:alpha/beta hydrolase n=1 Tax=Kibdelosporangium phytohabitans TaxID=860235 RepID=UPI0014706881|nr:alpha/beta hydrolase [Kibdelosporangium phytohabitans]MBE1463349.1 pimeloyl-ACP methyl ester carboxylesterase [Kibdelosporangium phytohabitans]
MAKIKSVLLASVVAGTMFTCTQAQAKETIDWRACPEAPKDHPVRCAAVRVPADWSTGRGQVSLRIARLPAADVSKRVGVLMFNPGGPGSGAAGYLTQPLYAERYLGKAVLERFDVVGIDPRGVAGSEPIKCDKPAHDPAVDRFPADTAGVRALIAANAAFAQSCHGSAAEHLDTVSVAHDMDAVRSLLGERQISFLGVSYGTMLGRAYAERFPDRLRALVLDAIADRSLGAGKLAIDDAKAVQDSVNRFAGWCAGQTGCGVDVPEALRSVQDMADRGQLKAGQANVTAREVQMGVNAFLQSPMLYPNLATALKAAQQGDGTAIHQTGMHTDPWGYGMYRSIICQDVDTRGVAARLPELGRTAREVAPDLRGYSEFWDIMSGCVGWPIPAQWQPHPWRATAQLPPTLLVSGAHDVATPRLWAENTRRQLPNSMLLRWDGDGHAAWPMHNACANARTVDYLITRQLPPPSTVC